MMSEKTPLKLAIVSVEEMDWKEVMEGPIRGAVTSAELPRTRDCIQKVKSVNSRSYKRGACHP